MTESVVLYVEDSEPDIFLMERAIIKFGLAVDLVVCRDLRSTYAFLTDNEDPLPDLVLLDLNIRGRHSTEILHLIKRRKALRSIPVIIFSTTVTDADIENNWMANALIKKPNRAQKFGQIVAAIREVFLA